MKDIIQDLRVRKQDKSVAAETYRRFSRLEGAQYIASETALGWLSACLRQFKPKTVLEMGPGIGTVTELLLNHQSNVEQIVATESNEYCRAVLPRNLTLDNDPRLHVVKSVEELQEFDLQPDMIVGDGGFYSDAEYNTARENTIIFCEGSRAKLRRNFLDNLEGRQLTVSFERLATIPWRVAVNRRFFIPVPFPAYRKVECWVGMVEAADSQRKSRAA